MPSESRWRSGERHLQQGAAPYLARRRGHRSALLLRAARRIPRLRRDRQVRLHAHAHGVPAPLPDEVHRDRVGRRRSPRSATRSCARRSCATGAATRSRSPPSPMCQRGPGWDRRERSPCACSRRSRMPGDLDHSGRARRGGLRDRDRRPEGAGRQAGPVRRGPRRDLPLHVPPRRERRRRAARARRGDAPAAARQPPALLHRRGPRGLGRPERPGRALEGRRRTRCSRTSTRPRRWVTGRELLGRRPRRLRRADARALGEQAPRSPGMATEHIDELYTLARRSGAVGGKLVGAGGGGFLLVYARVPRTPGRRWRLRAPRSSSSTSSSRARRRPSTRDVGPCVSAIVGCGLIGHKRAEALRPEDDRDRHWTSAPRLPRRWPPSSAGRRARSLDELLALAPDVVVVATSHDQLAPLAERGAGLAAPTSWSRSRPGSARRRSSACQGRRTRRPARQGRVQPPLPPGHRSCGAGGALGRHGELLHIRGRYGHGGRLGVRPGVAGRPELSGGGELIDQGMHLLDLIHWLAGALPLHSALLRTQFWDAPVEDNAALILGEPDDRTSPWALLHVSWTEWKNTFSLEIYCRTREDPGRRPRPLVRAPDPAHLPHGPELGPPDLEQVALPRPRTPRGRPNGSTSPPPLPAKGAPRGAGRCPLRLGAGRGRLCRQPLRRDAGRGRMSASPWPSRPPAGWRALPQYQDGWVTGDGATEAFLSYVEGDPSVNWSAELESLHEESSRPISWTSGPARAILSRLGAAPARRPTIVDVGSSTGYLLEDLSRRLPGRDAGRRRPRLRRPRKAHEALPALLLRADACELPLGDASVDAAVSANLLEHIPDDRRALRRSRACCARAPGRWSWCRPGPAPTTTTTASSATSAGTGAASSREGTRRRPRGARGRPHRVAALSGVLARQAAQPPPAWRPRRRRPRARVAADIAGTRELRFGALVGEWRSACAAGCGSRSVFAPWSCYRKRGVGEMRSQLLSVVVPIFNEEENVERAYERIAAALDAGSRTCAGS